MMSVIPDQIRACNPSNDKDDPYKDKRLHPIFGSELYVNPLQIEYNSEKEFEKYKDSLDPAQRVRLRKSHHLLAIAYNNTGYSNLVKLTSLAWTKGYFNGRPRVNHQQLLKYKEGIFFTSCCYASEIGYAFDQGGEEAALPVVEKYLSMFGDKFFFEIMLLDFRKQKPYDAFIIKCHDKYKNKIIVTNDVHFANEQDSKYQRLMLMINTNSTFKEIEEKMKDSDDIFVLQDKNLWMKTEEELNQKWFSDYKDIIDYDIFAQAKLNTVEICRQAKGIQFDPSPKLPKIENANEKLLEEAWKGFNKRNLPKNKVYLSRFKEEYELICRKEFSSYFLVLKMIVDHAREMYPKLVPYGTAVDALGAGRGSSVSSLLCYSLGLTAVDPVDKGLLFSRFISPVRGGKIVKLKFSGKPL